VRIHAGRSAGYHPQQRLYFRPDPQGHGVIPTHLLLQPAQVVFPEVDAQADVELVVIAGPGCASPKAQAAPCSPPFHLSSLGSSWTIRIPSASRSASVARRANVWNR
jgi:hypothetical protein